jgi:hypothetical protein
MHIVLMLNLGILVHSSQTDIAVENETIGKQSGEEGAERK